MVIVFSIVTIIYLAFFMSCLGCSSNQPNPYQQVIMPTITPLIAGSRSDCVFGGVDISWNGTHTEICNGSNGAQGPQGETGAAGPQGPQGTSGNPGTTIAIITFCQGVTPQYPGIFPEVGFCINGNIYAVYSANDGFLAEIEPGVYQSDAISSVCTFRVLPNCQVTQ